MSSRRRAREFALQALYQADITESPPSEALESLWDGLLDTTGAPANRPAEEDEIQFARRIARGVERNKDELDALIEKSSVNWRLVRMPVVDRNILRLSAFEILYCPDVPSSVAINEAVELAKRFGDKDSRAFVNGILDRIAGDSGRGGRKHGGGAGAGA